jgi:hypothetical protein
MVILISSLLVQVDDDFLAHYQMNYGFSDSSTATPTDKITHTADTKENTGEQLPVKRKAVPQEPSEFIFFNSCHFPLKVVEFFILCLLHHFESRVAKWAEARQVNKMGLNFCVFFFHFISVAIVFQFNLITVINFYLIYINLLP